MFARFLRAIAAIAIVAGCAQPSLTPSPAHSSGFGPLYQDEIRTEIAHSGDILNAEQLLRALRPSFLQGRNPGSIVPEQVVVDDRLLGGLSWLATIPAASIISIEHMSSADACFRYGPRFGDGAIVITTGSTAAP